MLTLTPKAFAVLQYLVTHAGQLITKEALLAAGGRRCRSLYGGDCGSATSW
jgi:DNA-binding response OmpR family regulator